MSFLTHVQTKKLLSLVCRRVRISTPVGVPSHAGFLLKHGCRLPQLPPRNVCCCPNGQGPQPLGPWDRPVNASSQRTTGDHLTDSDVRPPWATSHQQGAWHCIQGLPCPHQSRGLTCESAFLDHHSQHDINHGRSGQQKQHWVFQQRELNKRNWISR